MADSIRVSVMSLIADLELDSMYESGQNTLSGGSLSYSSPLNSTMAQERSRVALGSPQVSGHGVASTTYSFSPNVGPSVPASYGGVGQTLNDSLAQSRPQYQPGYLLNVQAAGQRHEETHLIPTRAKMNPTFPRNTSSDFGSESMFENTSKHRHRDAADDEDGPPTSSVVDIVNDVHTDSYKLKPHNFSTPARSVSVHRISSPSPSVSHQILSVIVFGYPPSRYSSTAAHFQSVGDGGTTEPELSFDVENAFKIGYKQPWEAARAWRRNGEIISGEGGRWMVGVKWADPLVAEQVLGPGAKILSDPSLILGPETPPLSSSEDMDVSPDRASSSLQHVVATQRDSASIIGTPIKLAPSASAFRKAAPKLSRKDAPVRIQTVSTDSPEKGMFGQVSDLIFGW
ncbi:hypothetical protein EW145_g3455 [Phellinidium pouzarii]|uniref:RRM Nup35-type domain-containing protein n=1 Tax=Phellinidium pouzarii TaxID=167371 RepID=A0A4S4L799_9AGAM|nr:hypothetical protein EW145_g3455 [Phellinidium pouzarii]